ncbi:MAG: TonB-dependent copper receptor [Rhodothalassiaceae bacterium]
MTGLSGSLFPLLAASSLVTPPARAEAPIEEIIVISRPISTLFAVTEPLSDIGSGPDVAALLRRVPGANINANGPLTGQTQYRGLSALRLSVTIDGERPLSGGPNLMDPPFHYLPRPLLAKIEVARGIAPVSKGYGLGGAISAETKKARFAEGEGWTPQIDLSLSGATVDESFIGGGLIGAANETQRFHILCSFEDGGDYDSALGTVRDTSFRRKIIGIGYGRKFGDAEIGLDYSFQDTDPTGTPALPLDILKFNTHRAAATLKGKMREVDYRLRLGYSDVSHAMNNFLTRPAPQNPAAFRRAPAEADQLSWQGAIAFAAFAGRIEIGTDGAFESHDLTILNPNNDAFRIEAFRNAESNRASAYVEWSGMLAGNSDLVVGLRYNHVATNADPVFAAAILPPPLLGLAAAFNAADRSRTNDMIDASVNFSHHFSDRFGMQIGLARKTRAPSYIERYAWLPIEVTAGLADGNNHIGDIALVPETSYVVNIGFDIKAGDFYFSPDLFWRRVDDFIQSTAFDDSPGVINSPVEGVSNVNGDPTPLRFGNVDARLYGVDLSFGYRFPGSLRLDGVISYVRGERRDIDDDLYRIAPANALLILSYEQPDWKVSIEGRLVARQSHVSRTNDELETGGYGTVGLSGEWRALDWLKLVAGVDNLLDSKAFDHLAGFNRVAGNVVAIGERLPGRGINGFLRTRATF